MEHQPFFHRKTDRAETLMGPSFGQTIVLVLLLIVILCLALHGLDWRPFVPLLGHGLIPP